MGSITEPQGRHLLNKLHQAHQKYTNVHPMSHQSHGEACKVLPGGNTRTVLHTAPFPLAIAWAESCYLRTVDGLEYLDFLNEYSAGIYGHNHPLIRQAIQDTLDAGWNYGAHHAAEQMLAQCICSRFPAIEMVRFVNSGTEANMMALATALVVTQKKKILLFHKGYHGSTIAGHNSKSSASINLPHEFVIGHYNDVAGTKSLVSSLPSGTLAAILVEPMLGSGGCFTGSKEFLQTLRNIATEQQALLIFDEVMTSRIGYNGLGHQIGISPDIMTIGKYLGGGMSFGAFGGRADLMKLYDPRLNQLEHSGTFNNNAFSMKAGIAGCEILSKGRLDQLNALGDTLRNEIESVLQAIDPEGRIPDSPMSEDMHNARHPQRPPKMFIKGLGSLMTIHFAGPDRDLLAGLFFHHMLEEGIYIAPRGFMTLSIELEDVHLNKFTEAVAKFVVQYREDLEW